MSEKTWRTGNLSAYATRLPNVARTSGSTSSKRSGGMSEAEMRSALSQYSDILSASDAHYDAELDTLSKEKEDALRRAAVDQALLERYLPTTKAAEGLAGLGVSQSAKIDANNAYRRTLGEIESSYITGEGEINSKRAANRDSLMKYYGELLRADQDQLYESTLERIKDEKFMNLTELDKMLEEVAKYVRPEQLAHLTNVVNYYKSHPGYQAWG